MAIGGIGVAHLTLHQVQGRYFGESLAGRTAAMEQRLERDQEAMLAGVRSISESESAAALLGGQRRDAEALWKSLEWAATGPLDGMLLMDPQGEVAGQVGEIPRELALDPVTVGLLERGAGAWWTTAGDRTYQVVMTPVSASDRRIGLVLGARCLHGDRLAELSDEIGVDLVLTGEEQIRESALSVSMEAVGSNDPLAVLALHRAGEDRPHRLTLAGDYFMVQEIELDGRSSLGIALMLPMEPFGNAMGTARKRMFLLAMLAAFFGVLAALLNSHKVSSSIDGLVAVSRRAADGDLGPVRQQSSTTELAVLEDAMSDMLRQQRRHQERVAKAVRKDRDKEIGRWITQSVSQDLPDIPGFDMSVGVWRAEEAKGDGYNLFETEDGCLWVAVYDAAAAGLRAGMLSTLLHGAIESAVRSSTDSTPSSVMRALEPIVNNYLGNVDWPHHYVALRLVKIDMNGQMLYTGAHEEMIVLRGEESSSENPTWNGAWLGLGAAGPEDDPDGELKLGTGDTLILYTDGVYSGMDGAGRLLGTDRLNTIAEQANGQPSRVFIDRLLGHWEKWVDHPLDDATVVVVRRRAGI